MVNDARTAPIVEARGWGLPSNSRKYHYFVGGAEASGRLHSARGRRGPRRDGKRLVPGVLGMITLFDLITLSDEHDGGESLGWAFRCAMTQDEP